MNTKTENVKNFINHVGTENQLFLFIGSNTKDAKSNSVQSEIDAWKDSDFSVKVAKDNVIGVIPNIKWVRRRSYVPWSSVTQNSENFYVYNDNNGYVYICLSDNLDNRDDLLGKNVSTNIPSHVAGDHTYDDGYTWKALYRITPSLEKFVTESWIPVVSFDNFDLINKSSLFAQIQEFCYPSSTKDTAKCNVYFTKNMQIYDGNGVLIDGVKGALFKSYDITCIDCYNLFKNNKDFYVDFSTNVNISQTIEIKDTYDSIGEMIDNNIISTASPYYYLYQTNKNSPDEGHIVSVRINLSGIALDDLSVSQDNPRLTITSNTGSGASIALKTYRSATGKIIVNGIQLLDGGKGYKDIQLSMSATMLGSLSNSNLLSRITVNLDDIDGLGFDPMKALDVNHYMIDVKIDKQALKSANVSVPSSVNFYSLVQNPEYGVSYKYTAGSNENKYNSTIYRTTTKLELLTPTSNPEPNKSAYLEKNSDQKTLRDLKIATVTPSEIFNPTAVAYAEVKGLEYSEIQDISDNKGTINIDGTEFTIKSVPSYPLFAQYTGKILSTNKTTSIDVQDVDTAIICINMVKGM